MNQSQLPAGWTIIMDDTLDGDEWWWARNNHTGERTDTFRTIATVVRAIEKGEYYRVEQQT